VPVVAAGDEVLEEDDEPHPARTRAAPTSVVVTAAGRARGSRPRTTRTCRGNEESRTIESVPADLKIRRRNKGFTCSSHPNQVRPDLLGEASIVGVCT
jgi:hypothetical protein